MLKIGLIGGLSWVSTAAYYRRLNELAGVRGGGLTSARLVLESVDRRAYVEAVIDRRDEDAACAQIARAALDLEAARADFIVVCCNDVHRFVPVIAPSLGIPFLHIADAVAEAVRARGLRSVALLGVTKTMEADFYPERMARLGIETILPNEREKDFVHDTIYAELVHDVFDPQTRARYLELVDALSARGAEGVVLGCTELPLLLRADDTDVPLFDTVELHCRAAVARAFG